MFISLLRFDLFYFTVRHPACVLMRGNWAYGPTSIWGGMPSFARMDSVVAEIFRDPYSVEGGQKFSAPDSVGGGSGRVFSFDCSNRP